MKKIIALSLILITFLSCTSCTTLYNIFNPELDNKYDKLLDMLLFLDLGDNKFLHDIPERMIEIEELLEDFPENYEDVDEIRKEYQYFKSYFKALFNFKNSYSERHQAAMHLLEIDENYDRWNLTNAIYHYMPLFDILKVVLLSSWETVRVTNNIFGDGTTTIRYYLQFSEEDDGIYFSTNLPKDMESDVDYYYFTEGHTIGYYPQGDYSSRFNSYRITEISHKSITVYCYKNSTYYVLENKS